MFGGKTQKGSVHFPLCQEYDLLLAKLSVTWERKGDKQEPKASKYFMKNKAESVYHHCRSAALCEVGIDDELFDNNDPESINASIKKWENNEGVT